jgi:hypothetical protein
MFEELNINQNFEKAKDFDDLYWNIFGSSMQMFKFITLKQLYMLFISDIIYLRDRTNYGAQKTTKYGSLDDGSGHA